MSGAEQLSRVGEDARYRALFRRYKLATTSARVGVWEWDAETDTISSEDVELAEMLGFNPTQRQTGAHWQEAIHPADRDQVQAVWSALLAGQLDETTSEYRVVSDDGQVWWQHTRYIVSAREDGRACRIVGVTSDVTERKQAEEARRASEERYRAFFELNAAGATETTMPDGRFLRVNAAFCRLTGYSREELLTMRFTDLTHPDEREAGLEQFRRLGDGEIRHYSVEKRYVRKDGAVIWVRIEVSAGPADCGAPEYALAIVQDISEQRRAREALEEVNQRYRLATSAGRVAVWEFDTETSTGTIEAHTASGVRRFQNRAHRTMAEFLASLHPDDRDRVLATLSPVATGAIDVAECEYRVVEHDGSVIWLYSRCRLSEHGEGPRHRVVGITVDITERKRAEEEVQRLASRLQQAQDDERRRIAQGLHEQTAQALVASNLNLASYLHSHPDLDQEETDSLQDCLALGEQALEQIRTLSYVLHPPLLDELGLQAALAGFVDGFQRRSGIDVDLRVSQGLGRLPREVEIALYRVVQESLQNILQHSSSTRGSIRLAHDETSIILDVEDYGHGIETAEPRAREQVETRGVGIADMRQRLRQLGGHLDIHSGPTGTTITAVVPWERALKNGEQAPALGLH